MIRSLEQIKSRIDLATYITVLLVVCIMPVVYVSNNAVLCSEISCGYYLPKILTLRIGATVVAILLLLKIIISMSYNQGYSFNSFNWGSMVTRYPFQIVLGCLIIVTGISTVLSVSVDTSLWGRVPLSDGTSVYNTMAMIVISLGVLVSIRTPNRINQLFIGLVSVAVLVGIIGIARFYFMSSDGVSIPRLSSTLPNPLQAGSYFVFTIGFSIIFLHRIIRYIEIPTYYVIATLILLIQLLALGLTQSRGPIVISVIMMLILIAFHWWCSSYKTAVRIAIPVIVATLLTLIILTFSSEDVSGTDYVLGGESQSVVTALQGRFNSATQSASSGGMESRIRIWDDSFDVLFNPTEYEVLSQTEPIFRLMFGFGPDSFPLINGIGGSAYGPDSTVNKYLYAHNIFVQWVMELGFIGILLNLLIFLTVVIGAYKLVISRNKASVELRLLGVCFLGLLFFHLLDQMVNVSSVTDSTYRWVLLALMVQIVYGYSFHGEQSSVSLKTNTILRIVPIVLSMLLILALVLILWVKTVNYAIGSTYASSAQQLFASEEYAEASAMMDEAIVLAPDSYSYYNWKSEILEMSLGESTFDLECSVDYSNYNKCLVQKILQNDKKGADVRSLELTPTIEAANSALKTISFGLNNVDEFILYANRAQLIAPNDWALKNWIAMAYMNLGMLQESDHMLNVSYEITGAHPSSAQGLLLKGLIRQENGMLGEAVDYYTRVINLAVKNDMSAQAYNNRGMLYRESGQYENALYDFNQSLDIVGDSAEVHNNLGGLYLDNNRMSEALSSFSRAIYVNENYAPAYFNRSLVFASLGNEDKAFADALKAGDLGMEVDLLLEELENMIDAYNDLNSD